MRTKLYISILQINLKIQLMNAQKKSFISFVRREDLSNKDRFLIAYIFLFQKEWGTVTRLANKYNTSRTFIYDNVKKFEKTLEKD